jgi:SNF2 family DNA or RNA helicase
MLLMIDNYDSFTYNLVQYFGELGEDVRVYRNDKITIEEIEKLRPHRLVISPGPCTPKEAGLSVEAIRHFADLLDFQLEGVQALVTRPALLLADDMGLGKTVQAIAALRLLFHRREISRALIVAPASLLIQWRRMIREWAPEFRVSTVRGSGTERAWQWDAPVDIHLVGYETLRSDFTENPLSKPRRLPWDVVVLDEANPFLALDVIRGELLYCEDADEQAEYDLYVLRRATDLEPFERQRIRQILTGEPP